MSPAAYARTMLEQEARAMLSRLAMVKPFALQESVLPAAALLPVAQSAIDKCLLIGRGQLRTLLQNYVRWLRRIDDGVTPAQAQRRFSILRLKFNIVLTQFDMFADVITQRSESETGVWLGGLDVAATDALSLPGYYESPPVICYLDRDIGAAIRRARTRLPGGVENPVAIIRVPRERMVGSGIASSLVHEVGHQGAALLDLVNSLRPVLQALQRGAGPDRIAWSLWERWISEIVADLWSVARVGVGSTQGLINVVSLPRPFLFRLNLDDPHPMPWLRVKLSAAMGEALYPHPQWARIASLWHSYYPLQGLPPETADILARMQASLPAFVALLVEHRPKALRGRSLRELFETAERQPARLEALHHEWVRDPSQMYRAQPMLVFAVIGQARSNGWLAPEDESVLVAKLLTYWALRATINTSELCAGIPKLYRVAA